MQRTYVIILAGGTGSRLWPSSRASKPKQFLDLLGTGQSMLQLTYQRFAKFIPPKNIFIITNKAYGKLVHEQLPFLGDTQIILEPIKRNTGAAVAYALFRLKAVDPGATVVISPGDNMIFDLEAFELAVRQSVEHVRKNDTLVTFGNLPKTPDHNTGYIQFLPSSDASSLFHKVKTFIEKPSPEFAYTFYKSGEFFQYTGHFITKLDFLLKAYQANLPDLYEALAEKESVFATPEEQKTMEQIYSFIDNVSFRSGVLYKLNNIKVMSCRFGWTDLTFWTEVHRSHEKDYVGNAVSGKQVVMYNSANCLVRVPQDKLVIIRDLDGYIIIDSEDVLMICPIEEESEIKSMLSSDRKIKIERYL
jgi:mannose-1-phosphate guanylyltransferase